MEITSLESPGCAPSGAGVTNCDVYGNYTITIRGASFGTAVVSIPRDMLRR